MKKFRPYATNQSFLLEQNPEDWLPKDHVVFFVRDVVAELDLSSFFQAYEVEERGAPPFHPQMMVGVLLYAYCSGVRSSRKISKLLEDSVAFRVLSGNQQPDFRTISEFRRRHLRALEGLFTQVLLLCSKAGLVKLGHVAIDGTRIRANASKRKAMSLKGLREHEAQLRQEVQRMLQEAEAADAAEDEELGAKRGDELPPELQDRQSRLRRISELRRELEERERLDAEAVGRRETEPRDSAQFNFTDPDSRVMPDNANRGAFLQGYNGQLAVDTKAHVIVGCTMEQTPIDNLVLSGVLDSIDKNTGVLPVEVSLDAGYNAEANLWELRERGVDAYVSMSKHKRDYVEESAQKATCRSKGPLARAMARKVASKRGKERYGLRKRTVEPVFGFLKEGLGFRRFSFRGLFKVRAEWSLVCTVHNLLKLFRARPVVG